MCPAAAAAESMNGYMAIDEADILGAGEEKAEEERSGGLVWGKSQANVQEEGQG